MNTPNHFDTIADVFNRVWYFSSEYKNFIHSHIMQDLSLKSSDILADIGGGTGSFTSRLMYEAGMRQAYCVEPSRAMCDEASKYENITVICGDGEHFLETRTPVSKLLFKEVIHHLPHRNKFFVKCFEHLPQGGKLLIITRPQYVVFPFFNGAKEIFARNQPPLQEIENELKNAGFQVMTHHRSHTFTLPKEDWYTMLRHRFMSDLGGFSDAEIEAGIDEIEREYPDQTMNITDNLIFITAIK